MARAGESNPELGFASNIAVSAYRKTLLAVVAAVAMLPLAATATPIKPTAQELLKELQRPPETFIPARVGWTSPQKPAANFSLTLERYGPQATARAVHASLKAALTPDPIAMGALLFCAFALRWIRARREERESTALGQGPEVALPRAA